MDSLQLQAEMPALLALVIEAMKTHPSAPEAGWAGDIVTKVWQVWGRRYANHDFYSEEFGICSETKLITVPGNLTWKWNAAWKSSVSIYFHTEFIYKLVIFTCMIAGGCIHWYVTMGTPRCWKAFSEISEKKSGLLVPIWNLDEKNPGRWREVDWSPWVVCSLDFLNILRLLICTQQHCRSVALLLFDPIPGNIDTFPRNHGLVGDEEWHRH